MKVNTSELTGPTLDWAVAFARGAMNHYPELRTAAGFREHQARYPQHCYQQYWEQCGEIIDLEGISLSRHPDQHNWMAWIKNIGTTREGPTARIAILRCFVARKLGDEVDVPEELL